MKKIGIFFILIVIGCASNPPDIGVFTWFDMDHGRGTKIFTGGTINVDQTQKYEDETWPDFIKNGVHISHGDYAKLEEWIINYCKKKPSCSQNYLEGLQSVFKRIDEQNAK